MSVQQLAQQAGDLTPAERRELIGLLLRQGREQSDTYWDRIAEKIQDTDPSHWVAEEDLDRALNIDSAKG